MQSPRKWLRPWMAWSAVTAMAATGPAMGQVPNLGGSGGVPSVGGTNVPNVPNVPNVGARANQVGTVPNVPSNVPRVNRPNVRSNTRNTVRGAVDQTQQTRRDLQNNADGRVQNAARPAASSARSFQRPQQGTEDFSRNLPVRFDAQSVAGLGQSGSPGFSVDTTGDRLKISSVETGSLAAASGLQANDQILAVNRNWVTSTDGFRNDLQSALASTGEAWVMVRRNGNDQWVKLNADGAASALMGASYAVDRNGLTIDSVSEGAAAAAAGLQSGDRIVSINGTPITSRAEYLNQIQQNAGNQVRLEVNRDGATETVTASLPTVQQAAQRTLRNARGKVAEMQQIVQSLQDSAGQTARGRYQQVQQQLNGLNNQLQSRTDDVQSLTQAQIQQTRRRLSEINNSVNAWKEAATGNAANQIKSLQDKIAYTQSLLASRVFETKNSAMTAARSVSGSAKETVEGRTGQARDIVAAQRQALNRRVDSLNTRIDRLAESQAEQLGDRLATVRQNVSRVRQAVGQQADEARQQTAETLSEARAAAAELRSDLESVQADVQAEADADVGAAVSDIVAVQAGLTALAIAQADTSAQLATEIQADVQQSSDGLVNAVQQIHAEADQRLQAQTQPLITSAQQIRQRTQNLADAQTDRILALRDQVASLQNRLLLTARQVQGQARTRLRDAVGSAAVFRSQLTALAMTQREQAQQTAQTMLDRTRTRVADTRQDLDVVRREVQGQAQDRINTAQQRLESVRGQLGDRLGETREFTSEQRSQMVARLQQARADLMAAAESAPDSVRESISEQIARIDTVVEDLAIVEALQSTRVKVAANKASELGLEIETAAGRARVTAVQSGSAFAEAGLRDGDEIVAVNGQDVSTEAELLDRLNAAVAADEAVTLQVRRGDQQQTMTLDASRISLTSVQNQTR